MPSADFNVSVHAQAIPYSDTYYRLSDADKQQVNLIFVNELNTLIQLPPQDWHNLSFPNRSYEEILAEVNPMLMPVVHPPAGRLLVLPTQDAVYWKPTSMGHSIGFMARLSDTSGANITGWELTPVNFQNTVHLGRVGFAYECVPA